MALVVNDRVKETSTTTGTGTFTLDGAVTGFETFSSAIGNSNTTYYAIEIPNSTEFEVGLGTVAAGTLARTTVISSSNSDALVDFSAGTKNVFCTLPASKAVIEDASNDVTLPADLTVGTDTFHVDSTNEKVSIGTTLGSYTGLNVVKKSGPGNIYVHLNGNPGTIIGTSLLSEGTSGDFIINTRDNADIRIYTNNTLRSEFKNNGNFYVDTDTLYVDAVNDRVGIGTTSPSAKLDVLHTAADVGSFIRNNNSGSGQIKLGNSDGFVRVGGQNGSFEVYNSSNTSARLYIDNVGNVGLGNNTSPSSLLHLSSADPQITITDTDGTGSQVISASTDDLKFDVVGKTVIDSDSGGTLQLLDGGTSYLKFFEFGTYAALESMISDNDFKIRGNDGGSFFDALTFDMSDEGFAEFNSKIRVEADSSANAILVKGRSADDIGTIKFTANDGSGNQGELSARSSVFIFNTPTQTNLRINNTDKLILTSSQVNLKDTVFVDVNEQIQFGDAGEYIYGDGSNLQFVSSNAVGFDAANGIILDGGSGGTILKAGGGTTYGSLVNSSGDLIIKSGTTTALTFSGANVTLPADLTIGANLDVSSGTIKLAGSYPVGTNNVALGSNAGTNLTSGSQSNTLIGNFAGDNISATDFNTAVGNQALRIGSGSNLRENTAIGYKALEASTTPGNTAVGYQAGINISVGNNNTVIGASATASSASVDNEITLGNSSVTSLRIPGLQSGATSGDVLTYDGTDITLSTPSTGASAGFAIAMAIAL